MSVSLLVCFAVKEEARHFRMAGPGRILVTGMGQTAARVALEQALLEERPGLETDVQPATPETTASYRTFCGT